jgi:hypothetical protein
MDLLIEKPETLDKWRLALPRISTIEEHANEIEEIYRQVLQGAR